MTTGVRKFNELSGISEKTLEVLEALNFQTCTPVQEATIPLFCGNKDVAVDASTGSGKTLAFLVPVVEKLRRLEEPLTKHQVGAVIISPTRELARQIFTVAQPFFQSVQGLTAQILVGGTDPALDVSHFKEQGAHVLVGTPGRIDDVIKRCGTSIMDFKRLEVLVLDEADRLLDMGFKNQLDTIMACLPKQRRTGLFSATQTEAVEALARAGLRNPVRVNVAVTSANRQAGAGLSSTSGADVMQKTPTGLNIQYVVCEADQKLQELVLFLQKYSSQKIIVYFLTCNCVDFASIALKKLGPQHLPGLQFRALHGRMKQAARESTLESYTKLQAGCLLCTDLAARGLDIPDVNWILQFDPPQDPSSFVHRVGRTARMGRIGHALVMIMPHETSYVEFLQLRKVPLLEVDRLGGMIDESVSREPAQGFPKTIGPQDPLLQVLRKEAEADREVMEAGTRAFVSYVRGYKEHHCKYIFRIQDLNLGRLATLFALLRLPKMPEVKKARGQLEHFTPSLVNPDTVKFKDKAREKQRQQTIQKRAAVESSTAAQLSAGSQEGEGHGANKLAASSSNPKEKLSHLQKQEQHLAGERLTAVKRRQLQQRDELQDLTQEYALLKKLKKGKITQHEFNLATGLSSEDEEEEAFHEPAQQPSHPQSAMRLRTTTTDDESSDAIQDDEDSMMAGSSNDDDDNVCNITASNKKKGRGSSSSAAAVARNNKAGHQINGGGHRKIIRPAGNTALTKQKAQRASGKQLKPNSSTNKSWPAAGHSALQSYSELKKRRQKRKGKGGGSRAGV
ncbi:hypothetical protein CEUSTIGMA_g11213.t1 [Chlamydomonas eustigma]|uniref:ATP-dependent RNA helicase n=1 Tax=Chlamydomonas eustigma TaxID=1157962 RepID=A0A250XL31_9CHLO|nr:hypothetical protein CEUSTIGMA_g11213.t1 [Chlamydomonas eustigma]|eukprot:GAX83788.1 hypothetical protein CEUSTIGMA_g11213.t1 [Chlamydomonas eustigma]